MPVWAPASPRKLPDQPSTRASTAETDLPRLLAHPIRGRHSRPHTTSRSPTSPRRRPGSARATRPAPNIPSKATHRGRRDGPPVSTVKHSRPAHLHTGGAPARLAAAPGGVRGDARMRQPPPPAAFGAPRARDLQHVRPTRTPAVDDDNNVDDLATARRRQLSQLQDTAGSHLPGHQPDRAHGGMSASTQRRHESYVCGISLPKLEAIAFRVYRMPKRRRVIGSARRSVRHRAVRRRRR